MEKAIKFVVLIAIILNGCSTNSKSSVHRVFDVKSKSSSDGTRLHVVLCNISSEDILLEEPKMGFAYTVQYADSEGNPHSISTGTRVELVGCSWRFLQRSVDKHMATHGSYYRLDIPLPADGKVHRVKLKVRYVSMGQLKKINSTEEWDQMLENNETEIVIEYHLTTSVLKSCPLYSIIHRLQINLDAICA
jgi:hypothetical protein